MKKSTPRAERCHGDSAAWRRRDHSRVFVRRHDRLGELVGVARAFGVAHGFFACDLAALTRFIGQARGLEHSSTFGSSRFVFWHFSLAAPSSKPPMSLASWKPEKSRGVQL